MSAKTPCAYCRAAGPRARFKCSQCGKVACSACLGGPCVFGNPVCQYCVCGARRRVPRFEKVCRVCQRAERGRKEAKGIAGPKGRRSVSSGADQGDPLLVCVVCGRAEHVGCSSGPRWPRVCSEDGLAICSDCKTLSSITFKYRSCNLLGFAGKRDCAALTLGLRSRAKSFFAALCKAAEGMRSYSPIPPDQRALRMLDKKVSDRSGAMRLFTLGATDAAIAARTYPVDAELPTLPAGSVEPVQSKPSGAAGDGMPAGGADGGAESHADPVAVLIPKLTNVTHAYSSEDLAAWRREEANRLSSDFPALPYPVAGASPVLTSVPIEILLY